MSGTRASLCVKLISGNRRKKMHLGAEDNPMESSEVEEEPVEPEVTLGVGAERDDLTGLEAKDDVHWVDFTTLQ